MSNVVATVLIVHGGFEGNLKKVWSSSGDNQKNYWNPIWNGLEVRFLGEDSCKDETYLMILGEKDTTNVLSQLPCRVKYATPFMTLQDLINHERKSEIGKVIDNNLMVIGAYRDEYESAASAFTERDIHYTQSRQITIPSVLALEGITAEVKVSESCEYDAKLDDLTSMNYPHGSRKRTFTVTVKLFKDGEPVYLAYPKKVGVDIMYDEDTREVTFVQYTDFLKNSKIAISSTGSLPYLRSCLRDIVNYLNAFSEDQCSLQTESKGKVVDFNNHKLV